MAPQRLRPIKHTIRGEDDPAYDDRHALLAFAAATQDCLLIRAAPRDETVVDACYRVMQVDDCPSPDAICLLLPTVTCPDTPHIVAIRLGDITFVQHQGITAGHIV